MKQFLLITVIGETKSNTITNVTEFIQEYECIIEKSRLTTIGNHWALVAQINGPWNHITKLETALPVFSKSHQLTISSRRCSDFPFEQDMLPYTIEITSLASDKLLHEMCSFLDSMDTIITELSTQMSPKPCATPIFDTIIIKIYLPADTQLSDFHEQFLLLCDELNIDALLEPDK